MEIYRSNDTEKSDTFVGRVVPFFLGGLLFSIFGFGLIGAEYHVENE
ncbi:hypothetical protein [Haladaptatus sp. NG-SE-30]